MSSRIPIDARRPRQAWISKGRAVCIELNQDGDGARRRTTLGDRGTVWRNMKSITAARCKSAFHCVLVKVRAAYSVRRWRWTSRIMPSVENGTP
ncbi:UNVERIFIED_CONTAM: hypothetical protein Sradi_4130000 [Sesamum radiatum]|uniref:Uncharacterized protein n=1 Tax=Sesamum radiatum TaxID=300843 RepID=A0AAW2P466_SESRA